MMEASSHFLKFAFLHGGGSDQMDGCHVDIILMVSEKILQLSYVYNFGLNEDRFHSSYIPR